jgi:2-dehydropantoate 2-reductase
MHGALVRSRAVRIGIVGPGAMGLSLAYFLKRSGSEPALIARDAERASLLRSGVEFTGFPSGEAPARERISFAASHEASSLSDADIVFILVKAYDTEKAAAAFRGVLPEACVIASLQNGLGNAEILMSAFPSNPVVSGSLSMGAFRTGPASVTFGGPGETVLGNARGGGGPGCAETARAALSGAGLLVRVTENSARAVWEKAIVNAAINPAASIANVANGGILESESLRAILDEAAREASAVAEARGFSLDGGKMAERAREACRRTAGNLCSMLQDLRAGRRTEIGAINGRIAEYAREAGIEAPVNRTLARLVMALERSLPG